MRRRARLVLVSAAALAVASFPAPRALAPAAFAQQPDSVMEQQKREELERIQRAAREKREAAQRLKAQESKALVQLRGTDRQLGATRKRLQRLQRQRSQIDHQLDVTSANLERSLQSLDRQRARLARRLRNAYKTGAGRDLEFLLSTRSFGQLLARWDFLVMVAQQDHLLLESIRGQKEQVEADKQQLELHLNQVQKVATRTSAETNRLANLRRERATTVKTIQSQREAYEAAARQLEKDAGAIRGLLARLEAKRREEAARAQAQGRVVQPYSGDFARGEGQMDWPVRGDVVGHFGNEVHPKWGTVTPNNGVDIACPIGTSVRVVAKGRIEYMSDDYGSYGQMILVNHGDGYYTMYAHLSAVAVVVGQEVTPGQVIARSGDSGSLKGPVLHFEVRKGGTALDPLTWLR